MNDLLCDLMAHAEWANAVFFKRLGRVSRAETMKRCGAVWAISSGFSMDSFRYYAERAREALQPALRRLSKKSRTAQCPRMTGLREFTVALDAGGLSRTVRDPMVSRSAVHKSRLPKLSCRWQCTPSITGGNA